MALFIISSARRDTDTVAKRTRNVGLSLDSAFKRGVKKYFIKTVIRVAKQRLVGTDVYLVTCKGRRV